MKICYDCEIEFDPSLDACPECNQEPRMPPEPCAGCKEDFRPRPPIRIGRIELAAQRHCDKCRAQFDAELVAKENELARQKDERQRKDREARWEALCPPLYRDTDLNHPKLDRRALEAISKWDFKKGMGFIGESGRGKTRLLFTALRRAFDERMSVDAISHNRFSRIVIEAFTAEKKGDAMKWLERFQNVDVLLLDDLGKAPRTERADAELEEMVEHRCAHGLPILWTANAGGQWLETRFGEDRGPALVRRLAEFCDCLTLR